MKDYYKDKTILVTGGCGSIGAWIVKQLLTKDIKELKILDNNEYQLFRTERRLQGNKKVKLFFGDIRDKKQLLNVMTNVDIVFHAGALKHVPLCEFNPFEAVKTNIIGTQNVLETAEEKNVNKVIVISTDKAVNPVNTMGASKMIAERLALNPVFENSKTKFSCVRFGNVLASSGSVIEIFRKQILNGESVTVTHKDMTRFFMSINEASNLILYAGEKAKGGEIFILKMKSLRIKDLAEVMINKLSKGKDIKIKMIGLRAGEKMTESLLTEEEYPFTSFEDGMYVLRPRFTPTHMNTPTYTETKPFSEISFGELNSSTKKLLSKKEIEEELKDILEVKNATDKNK